MTNKIINTMKNIMISQKNYILVLSGMTIINLTMFISPNSYLMAGSEIGNGGKFSFPLRATINGLQKNYLFKGPFPTKVSISSTKDIYEFDVGAISISVGIEKYDPTKCPISKGFKTVCYQLTDSQVTGYIVYNNKQTYYIEINSRRLSHHNLNKLFNVVAFTFFSI